MLLRWQFGSFGLQGSKGASNRRSGCCRFNDSVKLTSFGCQEWTGYVIGVFLRELVSDLGNVLAFFLAYFL